MKNPENILKKIQLLYYTLGWWWRKPQWTVQQYKPNCVWYIMRNGFHWETTCHKHCEEAVGEAIKLAKEEEYEYFESIGYPKVFKINT